MSTEILTRLPAPPKRKCGWSWDEGTDSFSPEQNAASLPLISIVTASYNQVEFLEGTVQSILLQNYPNLEYIVMDGASTDGSLDVLRKYANHFAYWRSEKDGGQASALISGFQRAKGEILGFVNSDDILLPGALETVGHFFAQNRDTDLLIGKSVLIDTENHITYPVLGLAPSFYSLLFWGSGGFNQTASFFRREAFFSSGCFDSSLNFSFDYDMYLRLTRGQRVRQVNSYLAAFRIQPASKTSTLQEVRKREDALLQYRNGIDRYPLILRKMIRGYYHMRYLILAGLFKLKIRIGLEALPSVNTPSLG